MAKKDYDIFGNDKRIKKISPLEELLKKYPINNSDYDLSKPLKLISPDDFINERQKELNSPLNPDFKKELNTPLKPQNPGRKPNHFFARDPKHTAPPKKEAPKTPPPVKPPEKRELTKEERKEMRRLARELHKGMKKGRKP